MADEPKKLPDATMLLARVNDGDTAAAEELLPIVYEQLRAMAGSYFKAQPSGHTLQPTALVHEAYIKLINASDSNWQNSVHFCAVAATAMRQILHDRARRKRTAKRGGGNAQRVPLDTIATPSGDSVVDTVAMDDALERLGTLDARQARIVELRFFGGLTVEQVATVLEVSQSTVEKEWRAARAFLNRELSGAAKV
ncbi:MAG: ECF-type sigma factor [Phycisphaerales bacterium]|nr:ECF-type sigma factor [Phycisphaerales bacterium]